MHFLDRSTVTTPPALAQYGMQHTWNDVVAADKEQIRDALGALQQERCAYCERPLASEKRQPHIEHFEQRARAPDKTFSWDNLFWSCSQPNHCGKHKDSPAIIDSYVRADLLKPDVDDPRRFLEFTSSGHVRPRRHLSASASRRASETIRVFALDAASLRTARVAYLTEPLRLALEAIELPPSDAQLLLASYAHEYRGTPYEAAIFDILGVP